MKAALMFAGILIVFVEVFGQTKKTFESTKISFVIKNAGLNVNGSIGGLEGTMTINSTSQLIDKIEGTLDANTILTGINLRDNHLKKKDYFNVKDFPKIIMTSTEIKKSGGRKYTGIFDLTIKDITKKITVPFSLSEVGNVYKLKGEFSINRLDYGLGESSVVLSDNVTVTLEVNVIK
jgi:polyisoprenoid-binding protein YceI